MANTKQLAKEKEMAMSVSNVYLHVVEDVINNVRADFQSEGVDDNVLNELQSLWELKLVQSGAIQESSGHEAPTNPAAKAAPPAAATAVHDLNVPYVATEEYEAPSNDMSFSRVPASASSREPVMFQYMPPGPSEESLQLNSGHHGLSSRMGNGTPSSFMPQPASWMNQKHRGVELNMNETYEEREEGDNGLAQMPVAAQGAPPITKDFLTISTGKRKHDEISSGFYIPQRDGATGDELSTSMDEACQNMESEAVGSWVAERNIGRSGDSGLWLTHRQSADAAIEEMIRAKYSVGLGIVPQLDGLDDEYDDAVAEDYNEPEEDDIPPASVAATPAAVEPTESEGSEPPLNEDDDDDDVDDADHGDEEPATNHLVLAQFDKVTRSKNKWKCTLKDGIMHLNNRDILFVKATGEFEF